MANLGGVTCEVRDQRPKSVQSMVKLLKRAHQSLDPIAFVTIESMGVSHPRNTTHYVMYTAFKVLHLTVYTLAFLFQN